MNKNVNGMSSGWSILLSIQHAWVLFECCVRTNNGFFFVNKNTSSYRVSISISFFFLFRVLIRTFVPEHPVEL